MGGARKKAHRPDRSRQTNRGQRARHRRQGRSRIRALSLECSACARDRRGHRRRPLDVARENARPSRHDDRAQDLSDRAHSRRQGSAAAQKKLDLAIKRKSDLKPWLDKNGNPWLDPHQRVVWQYAVDLANEAYDLGFSEVQFDYVRFPDEKRLATEAVYPLANGRTRAK